MIPAGQHEPIAKMTFASVCPMYIAKVEKSVEQRKSSMR